MRLWGTMAICATVVWPSKLPFKLLLSSSEFYPLLDARSGEDKKPEPILAKRQFPSSIEGLLVEEFLGTEREAFPTRLKKKKTPFQK